MLRPIKASYHLFRSGLGIGTTHEQSQSEQTSSNQQQSESLQYIGCIPSIASSNQNHKQSANSDDLLFANDCLLQDGPFIPSNLKTNVLHLQSQGFINELNVKANHSTATDISTDSSNHWDALLIGTYLTPNLNVNKSNELLHYPTVCYLKYNGIKLTTEFTSFRDADYWTGLSTTVRVSSVEYPNSLLALTSNGFQMKWFHINKSLETINSTSLIQTYNLSIEIRKFWTASIGAPNVIIYVTATSPEQIIITKRGSYEFTLPTSTTPSSTTTTSTTTTAVIMNELYENESVIDIIWQPIPTSFSSRMKSTTNETRQQQKIWLTSAVGPLLGVLTTHRVLLFTSQLILLNSYNYRNKNIQNNIEINENRNNSVKSIHWIACSLVYSNENGSIHYLLPIMKFNQLFHTNNNDNKLTVSQTSFRMDEYEQNSNGHLCTIPVNSESFHSFRIVAILTDRILIINTINTKKCWEITISYRTRPFYAIEVVLLGLLVTQSAIESHNSTVAIIEDKLKLERLNTLTILSLLYYSNNSHNNSQIADDTSH